MRKFDSGPLLRAEIFNRALGETGYPVFKMAFQLRIAIHRLDAGRDLARHLAIPQNDQGGDRTDCTAVSRRYLSRGRHQRSGSGESARQQLVMRFEWQCSH